MSPSRSTAPKAAYLMLLIGFFCSVVSAFLMAPLNVLDGQAHWHKMVQVSQFELQPKQIAANTYGGELDWPAIRLSQLAGDAFSSPGPADAGLYRNWAALLNTDKDHIRVNQNFSASAIYPPLAYAPGALALALARKSGFDILDQYFLACIANAFAFFALMALAIRLLPGIHLAIAAISTAPSMLFMAGSISGDPLNFAIPVLFFAYCWSLHQNRTRLQVYQYVLLGAGMFALALLKPTMLVFAAFVLLTVQNRPFFAETQTAKTSFVRWQAGTLSWVQQVVPLVMVGIPALLFWWYWHKQFPFDPGPYFGWDTNPQQVKAMLFSHPWQSLGFVWDKMFADPVLTWAHSLTFTGGHGNEFNVAAPMAVTALIWIAMVWSILFEPGPRRSMLAIFLPVLLAFGFAFGIYLGFWIWMTPLGIDEIRGAQPRYFLLVWVFLVAGLSGILAGKKRLVLWRPFVYASVLAANVGAWALPMTHFSRTWIW
jgi:uncharacterized membrane protein